MPSRRAPKKFTAVVDAYKLGYLDCKIGDATYYPLNDEEFFTEDEQDSVADTDLAEDQATDKTEAEENAVDETATKENATDQTTTKENAAHETGAKKDPDNGESHAEVSK
ncbi:unnamed protein product [Prunus armeniaca]